MARFATSRPWWQWSLALLGLVLALRGWLEWVGPVPGDHWSAQRLGTLYARHGVTYDVATLWAALGSGVVAIVQYAVALWFVPRERRLLVVLSAGVIPLNALLKVLLGPTPQFSAAMPTGHNYPSGHTAFATAFYGVLAGIALERGRRDIAAVLVGLAVVMGPSRVLGGYHLLSDVVAGYGVGVAWLLMSRWMVARMRVVARHSAGLRPAG